METPAENYGMNTGTGWVDNRENFITGAAGVAVAGVILFYYFGDSFWVPVHRSALFYASVKYSLSAAAVFLLLTSPAIKGEHGWDLRSFLIAGLCAAAFVISGALVFQTYNGAMDKTAPESHVVEVEGKIDACRNRGRSRAPCRYLVEVMGWRQGIESYKLSVPRGEFDHVQARQKYEVLTKPGALGFEWISGAVLRN